MRTPGCRSCDTAVDHCHGTLIVHVSRVEECTEPDCVDLDHARHTFVVDCGDIAGGCACAATEVRRTA
ncbi:hypothetical protein [Nocardia farcinica]|uniref:Uncharacterized protein n=1 Tax=Nocardia farcinica (strain IFM 10152) TaxID=247156 RepID=Q5Z349_NOCFA|nr:hypothetical protein [Nocardia farcinica]BAD55142.1 hypothetical protein NFA_3000 [Nocardia farcinica IFM 10152]